MSIQTPGTHTSMDTTLGDLLEADLPTRLAALQTLTDAITSTDIQDERDVHTGPELGQASALVHQVCARLTGKRYQWLAVEEADGRWATGPGRPRTFASHVAHTHNVSYASAHRAIRLARQLRDAIPQFAAALRAGRIGPDHIDAFTSTALTSPARIAALADPVDSEESEESDNTDGRGEKAPAHTLEDYLLGQAQALTVNQVRRLGRHFAALADPDADERGYREAKQREYVELVRTLDGWHLSGFLTEENGRLIRTAMDALMTPPAPDDERTPEQRRAQALTDVAHLALDQGLVGRYASVQPHLGVLIGAADLDHLLLTAQEPQPPISEPGGAGELTPRGRPTSAGPPIPARPWEQHPLHALTGIDWAQRLATTEPTFDDGTGPVPPALLRRLASCGGLYRILFSPTSEVINHGRERRLFTPAQRRALVARDQGCTWPGCAAPPVICESHHARIHWADGGPTDLANGALLCYHHHAIVDDRTITMTRRNGTWIFTRADGGTINPNPPIPTDSADTS